MSDSSFTIYRTLTANIRKRRKGKVTINIPIFRDAKTPSPFIESLPQNDEIEHPLADHIYMDCMCYGMGCCCLQVGPSS
jgi:glutamate--cysteine ligase catalytic subunit